MAGTFKDKGLVIREYPTGERDKRLTLLLLGRGRTTVFAKGAGNPKSKFHSCAQVFAFSEFVLYEGAGFMTVAQCELVDNFYGIRRDFERLILSSHVLEMADKMILPGISCVNELRLIYLTLSRLAEESCRPFMTAAAFEYKFLQMQGFCGSANDFSKAGLSDAAAKLVAYILDASIKDIFTVNDDEKTTAELARALDIFRREILDSPPNSLELLR